MKFFGRNKKGDDGDDGPKDPGPVPAVGFSPKDMANARKWFKKAKTLADNRNYDFAIESYLTGLKLWPEAVEEGLQLLRVAAVGRTERGGKKAGTLDVMKRSMSGKDPLQSLLNAEWLWAHEPHNLAYMEGIVKNAARGGYENTLLYIGPILFEAIKNEKKVPKDRMLTLLKAYEETGAACEARAELPKALQFYQGAMTVLQVLNTLSGHNQTFSRQLQDMATKVTIIKGKYDSDGDFRSSMKDSDAQKEIYDRDRMVVAEDRLGQLIGEARKQWAANPGVGSKLIALIDLLLKSGDPHLEKEAIELLIAEHAASGNYRYQMRADDIRIKQLRRKAQKAEKAGDSAAVKAATLEQLKFELKSFRDRVAAYPTDNRLKFQYGKLLVMARLFDDAIPVLQEARNDPKSRSQCTCLIGRCFHEKGFYSQSISTYNQGIAEHETQGDELSKELYYWLGRSCESAKQDADAKAAYGQVIQWDYNYKDARKRLAALEG